MKQAWLISFILLFHIPCLYGQFRPTVINEKKVTPPVSFEDCFVQLDSILKETFKQEIKNLPIDIATIKLEYTIGQFLLFKWKLNYRYDNFGYGAGGFRYDAPAFINDFFVYGIKEPSTVRRVIFRSYHKHLNNVPVNIKEESEYYKKLLGQSSFEISSQGSGSLLGNRIGHCEDSILNEYKISFITKTDTLGILIWNPGCSIECLLSGILIEKDEKTNIAQIYIFDIACSNRNTYALIDSIKVELYDTILYDLRKCFRLNYDYPTYITRGPYLWNEYINEKYKK
jgi:hypothetical protein